MWRAELAERTGLSRATVTRLTSELLGAGIIFEEATRPSGTAQLGRPPSILRVNPRAGGMVGVDIGASNMRLAAADLEGRFVLRREEPSHTTDGRAITVDGILRLIRSVIDDASKQGVPVRGVGIGVPSLTSDSGVVLNAPGLGWTNLPLRDIIEEALGLPTVVENDVNLAAVGEYAEGAGLAARGFVAVMVGTGVGAGIVIEGHLYRGARLAGGEIGYMLVDRKALEHNYPGYGYFEGLVGGAGIAERARTALLRAKSEERLKWPEDLSDLTSADVFHRRRSSRLAARLVEETVDYLSLGVANIACVLNPDCIVLGGGVIHNNPDLVEAVQARLEEKIPDPPALLRAALGEDAGVVGAIMLAQAAVLGRTGVDGECFSPGSRWDGSER